MCACALVVIQIAQADADCVRFTGKSDTEVSVYLASSRPVVFEIGKLGIPWRTVEDVRREGHFLKWKVKKGRVYEAWDAREFALAQLAEVRKSFGISAAGGRAHADALAKTLRLVRQSRSGDEESRAMARTRLEMALGAVLGVRIEVRAGVKQRLWPEYTLPVTCALRCGANGVRAKFSRLLLPDSWKVIEPAVRTQWRATIAAPIKASAKVKVPMVSMRYHVPYPVIAWYELEYAGCRFTLSNADETQVTDAFDREAWIDTVSDTQVDLHIKLTTLLPITGVTTTPYLPEGWSCDYYKKPFDVSNTKVLTYRITRPRNEKHGLRIVGGTFRFGSYSTSKRLITDHALDLGRAAAVTGLEMIRVKGDESRLMTLSDRKCRQTPASGRMYFNASANFSPGKETCLTLECAAEEAATLLVEYRTASGKMTSTEPQAITPASGWTELTFTLRDAVFDGSLPHAADFAVRSTRGQCGIAGISISRFRCPQRTDNRA
jgi:hypothetical protein